MCFSPQLRALFGHRMAIASSKSGTSMWCFEHFHFQICFAPPRRTFCTSQVPKVVRTWRVLYIITSKCASRHNGVYFFNISTSKSAPTMRCFVHFTSKSASRHNGLQLFMSHLPRCLRTRRFSEPTLRYPGATKHWKNTVFRDFSTFSRTCIFSLLTFSISSLLTSDLLFHLSILSEA